MKKLIYVILMNFIIYQSAIADKDKSCPPVPPGGSVDKNCKVTTIENPSKCKNKTVFVVAKPGHFESIKNNFLILSNLPYEVTEVKKESTQALIAISYWGDGPSSLALSEQVRSILQNKFSEYGIQSIRAEFDIKSNCK